MFTLYLFCLIVGGVFVGLAAIAGLDGADFELDFDPDVELVDSSNSMNQTKRRSSWIKTLGVPFFNLRFWTFGSCFFGLAGILLSVLGADLSARQVLMLAALVGLICGTAMVWVFRALQHQQADSLVRSQDLLGLQGVVEIPFDTESRGKVRLRVKGTWVDFSAMTEEKTAFAAGSPVYVVGVENNRVWVVSELAFGKTDD
ncbi:MAG: NfeD family protein [Microcoleaceae cyanobacterium]